MKLFAAAAKARRGGDWKTKKFKVEAENPKDAAKKAKEQAFSNFPSDKAWHSHEVYCVEVHIK